MALVCYRKDCTLYELVNLIKDINVDARKRGTELTFGLGELLKKVQIFFVQHISYTVKPHPRHPRFVLSKMGACVVGSRGSDDNLTLAQCKFDIGDYIDVSVATPSAVTPYSRNGGHDRRLSSGGDRDRAPPRRYNSYRD